MTHGMPIAERSRKDDMYVPAVGKKYIGAAIRPGNADYFETLTRENNTLWCVSGIVS